MVTNKELAEQQLASGFSLPPEHRYYANSFAMGTSPADVVLVLIQNGQSVAVINMSYQIAKTVAEKLNGLLTDIEKQTGQTILTTDAFGSALGVDIEETE
jgi:hypothetical protein